MYNFDLALTVFENMNSSTEGELTACYVIGDGKSVTEGRLSFECISGNWQPTPSW